MKLIVPRMVRLGVKNLLLHKLRSMLTMLGVVFGVASVVAMLAVGEGASKEALEQIRQLGSQNIIITAMKPVQDANNTQRTNMAIYGLTYADQQRIAETFDAVEQTVPVKLVRKEGRLRDKAMELRVVGTTPQWFELVQRPMAAGRVLTDRDAHGRTNVVVLTESGARKLLASENVVGQRIGIGADVFEVIGIVRNVAGGSSSVQTPDEEVDAYIPLAAAKERFGDVATRRTAGSMEREMVELHQLIVKVRSIEDVEPVAQGIDAMLTRFHKYEDYKMSVPLALLRQAEATKRTFNIVLGSIAGISLLVGGIGIMNIMLASVTERTREIGIRRAIGAKKKHIIQQFLVETVVLSFTGGIIGMALGVIIPNIIQAVAGMPVVVTPWSLMLSVGISVGVGVVFGLYPAMRAANLDPIVALRHE